MPKRESQYYVFDLWTEQYAYFGSPFYVMNHVIHSNHRMPTLDDPTNFQAIHLALP